MLLAIGVIWLLPTSTPATPSYMRLGIGTAVTLLPLLLLCYAPWTFFNIGRLLGLITVVGTIAYLVDEVRRGRYTTDPGQNQSVINAAQSLLFFGLPGLWVALLRRPAVCPYDPSGRPRPFEIERTFRLRLMNSELSEVAGAAQRKVKFDYRGPSKLEVLDAGEPPLLRVTLPMDRTGAAVWADWQRRMSEVGLTCDVTEERPGRRSFKDSVVQGVQGRFTPGRRAPKLPADADQADAS
ncbi:MAG: hypothetical protein JNL28_00890 [Planctomycetes bacterium]|nr:hypothetical protein [Planctomycetota bacterium]